MTLTKSLTLNYAIKY